MAARFDAFARAIKLADAAAMYLASAAALASARYFKSAIIAFAAFESDAAFSSARSLRPLRSSDNHSASWTALTALRVARLVSALALSSAFSDRQVVRVGLHILIARDKPCVGVHPVAGVLRCGHPGNAEGGAPCEHQQREGHLAHAALATDGSLSPHESKRIAVLGTYICLFFSSPGWQAACFFRYSLVRQNGQHSSRSHTRIRFLVVGRRVGPFAPDEIDRAKVAPLQLDHA
eukprot:scaffold64871_cov64-Phaeocystis_antarctica.AAC.5